jgi:hypothetical protein
METIDVCIPTWPNHPRRIDYLRQMLEHNEELRATGFSVRTYCSAESERDPACEWRGDDLEALCDQYAIELKWRIGPANLGANMNATMAMGSGELVYLQQDDWVLQERLDLSAGGRLLLDNPDVDIVRYNWPTAPGMEPTFCGDIKGWRLIDVQGPWPYGDDPHLRRRNFMDMWGWYYDKGKHGTASSALMRKLVLGNAKIVVADKPYYKHIGYVSAVVDDVRSGRGRRAEP